jgi:hypothetical protein
VEPPGPITNTDLLSPDLRTPLPKLVRREHFRGVVKEVWDFLQQTYGGGPAIIRPTIDIYAPPR